MAYRDDPDALRARHDFLASIRIATPCDASWDAMAGDDRVRHCALCDKKVYDVSQLTSAEAVALFGTDTLPCLRLHRRRDGTILTSDCPRGVARAKRRLAIAGATAAGVALAAAYGGDAVRVLTPPEATTDRVIDVSMGEPIPTGPFELDEHAFFREQPSARELPVPDADVVMTGLVMIHPESPALRELLTSDELHSADDILSPVAAERTASPR
jgi:hypothetical protein